MKNWLKHCNDFSAKKSRRIPTIIDTGSDKQEFFMMFLIIFIFAFYASNKIFLLNIIEFFLTCSPSRDYIGRSEDESWE